MVFKQKHRRILTDFAQDIIIIAKQKDIVKNRVNEEEVLHERMHGFEFT